MYNRYLSKAIKEFLNKKIIFLTGPRQVGKTTLSKNIFLNETAYYNYDIRKDISVFKMQEWDKDQKLVVFDEIHKMKNWKLWLKGLYDEGHLKRQAILVTGSARLNVSKKMGDSLAGRFFSYRLHPLDLKELAKIEGLEFDLEKNYQRLITTSNFPEPFYVGTRRFYQLWRKGHFDQIIKQDLLTLEKIRDIDGIELLIELLRTRVGSTITYKSLAEDLDRDDKTVKKWITALENLYVGFRIQSYSKNIARAKKKAFKFYFFDTGSVETEEGAKLENLVALAFLKELNYLEDVHGINGELYFIQTRDGKEIDFYVQLEKKYHVLVEVKLSETSISHSFKTIDKFFNDSHKFQIVKNSKATFENKESVKCVNALDFLKNLNFLNYIKIRT
ncbi:MAG: ATP-binding protein [Bacteriovorax sp.]|nr:ATP-binding protein [Bacteriovorax sp.]